MDGNGGVPPGRRGVLAGLGAGVLVTAAQLDGLLTGIARAQAPERVSHQLNWIKSIQFGGHFAAQERGFFAAEGIDAEIMAGGPGVDSIGLVAAGRATIGDRDSSSITLARARGVPIRAFAAPLQQSPFALMSLKSKPIRTLRDMVGKTIAIPTQRRAVMVALLRRAGIDPNSVTFVPVGTDPGMLATGQVDGYFGWATNQGVMLQMRGVEIEAVTVHDLGDRGYPMAFFATEETLARRGPAVLRWLRAEMRGWSWFADNPEETARFTVAKYAAPGLDLAQQVAEAKLYPPYIRGFDAARHGVMWIDRGFFEDGLKLLQEAGAITGALPNLDALVDQSLVRALHARA